MDLPLLENDLEAAGVIEPSAFLTARDAPACVAFCFFKEVVESLAAREDAKVVERFPWAHGDHTLYEIDHRGQRLGVLLPGVGSPCAAGLLEDCVALGCRTFVGVGGAGALRPDLVLGHAVVVDSAIRDEGTSFHYLPPSRAVEATTEGIAAIEATLREARRTVRNRSHLDYGRALSGDQVPGRTPPR